MKIYVGVDLGSTTTKAVLLDERRAVVGRGITNSRSNYEVASRVARQEALVTARFNLVRDALATDPTLEGAAKSFVPLLERTFRREQYRDQLGRLRDELKRSTDTERHREIRHELEEIVDRIVDEMDQRAERHYGALAVRKSDFFRDLAGADYMALAEGCAQPDRIDFETLSGLFDRAILPVENSTSETPVEKLVGRALDSALAASRSRRSDGADALSQAVETARAIRLEEASSVGTGYGRQRLPFPKEQIRSEILCHGLGAHVMFPATRTVLDIGGQDTKAIQVDENGIVTSFQMNDRCAAGCGRYLGYIADEMSLGVHELGPLAQQSTCHVKINSTCTVFAGAELRERLSLGQKREDILAGLHRAIVLRAMSLLARSGGVEDEFTFTGGVARNPAAVAALEQLVAENYGERTVNISPDSIYTGALGAAWFALGAARKAA
ncbi:MAG: benzoyl-CoA reductase subunit A [Thermoanaerobaculia bacterium]